MSAWSTQPLRRIWRALFVAASLIVAAAADDSMRTISDCVADGFDPLRLPCRLCNKMAAQPPFDSVQAFRSDCLECCRPDDLERGPFRRAELQISRGMSGRWGGVNEFLEKEADGFEKAGQLTVVDTPVAEPRVVLKDGEEGAQATLYIGSWKTEHVRELLHSFVSASGASDDRSAASASSGSASSGSSDSSASKVSRGVKDGDAKPKKKSKKRSESKKGKSA